MPLAPLRLPPMRLPQLSPALWTLFLACLVPELALSLADLAGASLWRALATGYLGFWPGLLGDWRPNYPGQAGAMFVTYGFLHAGPVHFAVNMMSLISLGSAVEESVGPRGFWRIYGAALVGEASAMACWSRGRCRWSGPRARFSAWPEPWSFGARAMGWCWGGPWVRSGGRWGCFWG